MLSVDLFAEDLAHDLVLKAMLARVLREANLLFQINTRSAVGGHGRAISELKLYQKAVAKGAPGLMIPDLLVVAIDANCKRYVEARNEIQAATDNSLAGDVIVACPDPHIERWFFADPASFGRAVGVIPTRERRKCERNHYKILLRDPNRMTNFGTSFDVEMGVARKDRTHGQALTTR